MKKIKDWYQQWLDAHTEEPRTEVVRPEDLREGDIVMVPFIITDRQNFGDPQYFHWHAKPQASTAWMVPAPGYIWTWGWSGTDPLQKVIRRVVKP